MIELTEERYDGEVAAALVADLLAEINERYAHEIEAMTPEELAAEDAEYLAEVTPDMVTRPRACSSWPGSTVNRMAAARSSRCQRAGHASGRRWISPASVGRNPQAST